MAYNTTTNLWEGYIYKIVNDINDKIYIGQTHTTLKKRWDAHRYQLKKISQNDKIHNAMIKYGLEHFSMILISKYTSNSRCDLDNILNEAEIKTIELYNSYFNGYNATKGGRDEIGHITKPVRQYDLDGNFIKEYPSVDILKKQYDSVSAIYDVCNQNGRLKYAYGSMWKYVDDKQSLPILEDWEKEEALNKYLMCKQIDKYDYKGNLIQTYKNAQDVLLNNNLTRRQLYNCCSGKGNSVIDFYVYRFHCDEFTKYNIQNIKPRLVEQYDINGNFIDVYKSVREAERKTSINNNTICGCCNGKYKTAGGFIWKYV